MAAQRQFHWNFALKNNISTGEGIAKTERQIWLKILKTKILTPIITKIYYDQYLCDWLYTKMIG